MGVTVTTRWATALSVGTKEDFSLVFRADGAGQGPFSWVSTLYQATPSGYVPVRTISGSFSGIAKYGTVSSTQQHTFTETGNYKLVTMSGTTKIGDSNAKVTAPFTIIQKKVLNDNNWLPNEAAQVECYNFGDALGNVVAKNIVVHEGGHFDASGALIYSNTRTVSFSDTFALAGGKSRLLTAGVGPLLPGYVWMEWDITCAEDTANSKSPVTLTGFVA